MGLYERVAQPLVLCGLPCHHLHVLYLLLIFQSRVASTERNTSTVPPIVRYEGTSSNIKTWELQLELKICRNENNNNIRNRLFFCFSII